jgi:streptomycin 6-kinase
MPGVSDLPLALVRNVQEAWGDRGSRWLGDLPELIDSIASRWRLAVGAAYPMSFNWVARATTADGRAVVLKIGVPDGHLDREAEALRIFDGDGAVRLLAAEPGALLIERAMPGETAATLVPADDARATAVLVSADDARATAVLVGAGRRLHRVPPPGCTLPHLRSESAAFRGYLRRFPGAGPMPRRLVSRAVELFEALCESAVDRVLHGDLHHENVLRSGDSWRVIDPHGWVGDPGFDCGAMLYNPNPPRRSARLLALVPARIEQLADGYRMPIERVRAWGFVMGVLSEVWNSQGGTVGTRALDVAQLIEPTLD